MARIILVHGSMHGAWCWEAVVPLLAALGHDVTAIDLPAQGDDSTPTESVTADDWAASVVRAIEAGPGRAIVVGHSMGGTAVAHAAERVPDRIAGLIFLSAILIPDGQTIVSACPEVMATSSAMAERYPDDPDAAAIAMFYAFTPHESAMRAIARLRPQPPLVVTAPMVLTDAQFGRVRRAYIECLDDGIVPIAVQRRMQARLPCDPVIAMAGDHSPFLSAPSALAANLDSIAQAWALSR